MFNQRASDGTKAVKSIVSLNQNGPVIFGPFHAVALNNQPPCSFTTRRENERKIFPPLPFYVHENGRRGILLNTRGIVIWMMEHFRQRESLLLVRGGLRTVGPRKKRQKTRAALPSVDAVQKRGITRERILRFDVTANYDAKKDTRLAIFG